MDLILRGGRVIDPSQGLDGIRDVGFANGKVAAIATRLDSPTHSGYSGRSLHHRLVASLCR